MKSVMIGTRVTEKVKSQLSREASDLGFTMALYLQHIIRNRQKQSIGKDRDGTSNQFDNQERR